MLSALSCHKTKQNKKKQGAPGDTYSGIEKVYGKSLHVQTKN